MRCVENNINWLSKVSGHYVGLFRRPAHTGFMKQVCGFTVAKWFHSFVDVHSPVKTSAASDSTAIEICGDLSRSPFKGQISLLHFSLGANKNTMRKQPPLDYYTWHELVFFRVECKVSYLKKQIRLSEEPLLPPTAALPPTPKWQGNMLRMATCCYFNGLFWRNVPLLCQMLGNFTMSVEGGIKYFELDPTDFSKDFTQL